MWGGKTGLPRRVRFQSEIKVIKEGIKDLLMYVKDYNNKKTTQQVCLQPSVGSVSSTQDLVTM